jgi:hypothetical protein
MNNNYGLYLKTFLTSYNNKTLTLHKKYNFQNLLSKFHANIMVSLKVIFIRLDSKTLQNLIYLN